MPEAQPLAPSIIMNSALQETKRIDTWLAEHLGSITNSKEPSNYTGQITQLAFIT